MKHREGGTRGFRLASGLAAGLALGLAGAGCAALTEPAPDPVLGTPREPSRDPAARLAVDHVVRQGESIAGIAADYGIHAENLARANGLEPGAALAPGIVLYVPGVPRQHVVAPGDWLSRVAERYAVDAEAIAALNGIENPNRIEVGSELLLPENAAWPPAPRSQLVRARSEADGEDGLVRARPEADGENGLARARALIAAAEAAYARADFGEAVERAREAERLVAAWTARADGLRAQAAFVSGSGLAGLGREDEALAAYRRSRRADPGFEPPAAWLSPRLQALLERASAASVGP